ncbi:MAG: hypothetical protein E5Y79_19125 [Mesorhizobium sp.]|uniref:hypothetical protein n=1 Tax=Mesorhizobium sp. TaxID=1871066 RepID=UPI0012066D14|nr:hypothetical protein [Mesorhizobium sp.]TIL58620.1 MAG: hypothetical protein E5Y79_19125 [Mesorhizobium sp.]
MSRTASKEISGSRRSGINAFESPPAIPAGASSDAWTDMLAEQTILTLWNDASSSEDRAKQLIAILDALERIAPRDELEGMMASQMIAAHSAAMECFRRAMLPTQTMVGRDENLGHANKLLRAFASLVETFNRHRGKNQQKVLVEHVHVHAGGQAVVGMVAHRGAIENEAEGQPHAKQTSDASGCPLPGEDQERE